MLTRLKYLWRELIEKAQLINENRILTVLDMIMCGVLYGASPNNYYHFDFRHASHAQRKTFVTHRVSEKLMRTLNASANTDVLYDKHMFAEKFQAYYGRSCFDSTSITSTMLSPLLGQKIIYKPLRGGQGRGIEVFFATESNVEMLVKAIRNLPRGVVESWIDQHSSMTAFYPHAVNPIRLQTICKDGNAHCLCATITVGCKGHEFANASNRSLFALVDIQTGRVYTNGCDYDGNLYLQHPETGVAFKNYQIPNWSDVLRIAKEAAERVPLIGYIGWDIAITNDGAVLIEGNNDPGYTAYQLPQLTGKHEGTLALFRSYL